VIRRWLDAQGRHGVSGAAAIFAILFAITLLLKGGHFSAFDLRTLCMNALPLVCIALGQFFVVLTNGIDLSIGPVMSVAGSVAALWLDASSPLAIGLALGVGLLAGLANALLVVVLRLPSILATLASMSVFQGIALIIMPSPGGSVPYELTSLLTGSVGIAPMPLLLLVAVALVTGWIMTTSFGLSLRAIGGDEAGAQASGVRVHAATFGAYLLAALLASLGGIYLTIATASGSPTIGDSFILLSITALVLGGATIGGGKGASLGVAFGGLTLTIIGRLLYFADLSSFYQSLINGLILIGVVGIESGRHKLFGRWRESMR
jgi:ribose transport system permease protein